MELTPNQSGLSPGACSSGYVVPGGRANAGLVEDCAALLAICDVLAGSALLDWGAGSPITQWEGVVAGNSPPRVLELTLPEGELTGILPPGNAKLAELRVLNLAGNGLSGPIPVELGRLSHRQVLDLSGNQLVGLIPPELGNLKELEEMVLDGGLLKGPIPSELGKLTRLRRRLVISRSLYGAIPPELGNLIKLRELRLRGSLSGPYSWRVGSIVSTPDLDLSVNDSSSPARSSAPSGLMTRSG